MKKHDSRPVRDEAKYEEPAGSAASANECTGLMSAPAADDYEWDSYCDVYDVSPSSPPKAK